MQFSPRHIIALYYNYSFKILALGFFKFQPQYSYECMQTHFRCNVIGLKLSQGNQKYLR